MSEIVNTPPLVVILGPTASGKTALGIKLAKKFSGQIISADSRQVYQKAQIGTCQPAGTWDKKHQIYKANKIIHYLIDILPPTETFSVEKFQKESTSLIKSITNNKSLPLVVGGTGLYLSSLIENYDLPQGEPNYKLRDELTELSTDDLNFQLKKIDPTTYSKIDHLNRVRIIRALEFNLTTGQSFSVNQKKSLRGNTLILGLSLSKEDLIKNINHRTKDMLKAGLIKETEYILQDYPASVLLKTIGYKETIRYLSGHINKNELVENINTHTWQYAKRQLTWFKKTPNISWVDNYKQAEKLVANFIDK